MRKLIILFIVIFPVLSFAQTSIYHPFPEQGGIWRIDWGEQSCFMSGSPQAKYNYVMNGDTLLNGLWYNIIDRYYGSNYLCGPFYPVGSGYMGGLRQDSLNRQVFFVPKDSTNEKLIYDFSLVIGDTVPNFLLHQYGVSNVTITRIDSVFIGIDFRKAFITSNGNTIVEGFGSLAGLLEVMVLDITPELLCFSQDGVELYKQIPNVDCNLIDGMADLTYPENLILIFPNPVHSNATISLRTYYSESTFVLYNSIGTKVKHIMCHDGLNSVMVEDLPCGLYFYQLLAGNHKSIMGSIAIN
ncbi:MAG: T9SS type A sorting domain-containing protein [Bacteroidetes bacterium]|nr:T9SS type A sorting domain-containing protein [Bacteroidota bacterium]MBK9544202.1 T9SS type A sorting domain-containing protein [Bacteroidota bacterium]